MWFIKKSNDGDGFQTWHKDLVNNGQIDLTIVLNTGSYVDSADTDDDSVDSVSAPVSSKSPPHFFLDGSQLAYYNLDDVPRESLEKISLARSFYLQCRNVCEFLPYDLCPLKIALQSDDRMRQILHDNNGRVLQVDVFNAEI